MAFKNILTPNKKAEDDSSLPSVYLTKQEAEVLLQAIKQASFKGEYAKEVVSLILRFEDHISKFN
jgi:hypothetical protein